MTQVLKSLLFILLILYNNHSFAMFDLNKILDPSCNIQIASKWKFYSTPSERLALAPHTEWSKGYAQWNGIRLHGGLENKIHPDYTDDWPISLELFANVRLFPNEPLKHEPKDLIIGLVPKVVVAQSETAQWFLGAGVSYMSAYHDTKTLKTESKKENSDSKESPEKTIGGNTFEGLGITLTTGFNKHINNRWHFSASTKLIIPVFSDKNHYVFLTQVGFKYNLC